MSVSSLPQNSSTLASGAVSPNMAASIGMGAAESGKPRTIREVAESFESMFIAQMMAPMFADIDPNGPFGGGQSEEMYRSLLTDQYGAAITKRGGIGIADAMERYLLKLQEG